MERTNGFLQVHKGVTHVTLCRSLELAIWYSETSFKTSFKNVGEEFRSFASGIAHRKSLFRNS